MDVVSSVPQMQYSECELDAFHHLGLKRCRPINPQKYPPERLQWLWERLQTQDYAFDDFSRNDPVLFALSLNDTGSMHFEVDDSAYIVLRGLRYSDNPNIHFCVWDKKMPFREILSCGREILSFAFTHLGVARITAPVPEYNERAIKFATLLGFRFEGLLRGAILYKEKHHNVHLYGLLRKEWEARS
jgi:hypothetical protein